MQTEVHYTQRDLMDAVIVHLDHLAQTGCLRAGHRARLLIDHIGDDDDSANDETPAMLRRLLERLEPCGER